MKWVILLILILAAYFDIKARTIPDYLTLPFIIFGIFLTIYNKGFLYGLGLIVITFLVAEILFRLKVFGGGDLKLFIMLIFLLGVTPALLTIYISMLFSLPVFLFYAVKEKTRKPKIPFAVPLLFSYFINLL